MKHIIICGERQVGKSTLISRLQAELTVPVYGVITKIMRKREDGFHEIYMFRPDDRERKISEANHLADSDSVNRRVSAELFETMGVELIREARPGGVIILDELGFMEASSPLFCNAVISAFDGDIPVLAAVKRGFENVDFLNRIKAHPKADLYMIDQDNRDDLYTELLPRIRGWN